MDFFGGPRSAMVPDSGAGVEDGVPGAIVVKFFVASRAQKSLHCVAHAATACLADKY